MPEQDHPELQRAYKHAIDFLDGLETAPVGATADLETLRARLGKPLADDPLPPDRVVEDLIDDSKGGIIGFAGGRFFAWVVGGSVPAALAADWLTSVWDQNAGIYASGPAAAVCEEVAGRWIAQLLGLPENAGFAFVTGCQMAHVTCLNAARYGVLTQHGWDVNRRGLFGAPPICIVSTSERHGSVARAIRMLGLGDDSVTDLPVDNQCRLRPETLEAALAADTGRPTIVLLQAGELCTGAFDPFAELIPIARKHNAWVHIDGAFGLWAAASPRFRHLVEGVGEADSWATDGHKWLNVPYDSGYAFVRDPAIHRASMSHRESYLIHASDARDQFDWNPEWSRRARGFPTYAALRQLGRNGVSQIVENCCDRARDLVLGIGSLPGAEIVWTPQINQGLVRFADRTDEIVARVMASGEAFLGGVTWRGLRCMRVSVSNYRTTPADVARVIKAFEKALAE